MTITPWPGPFYSFIVEQFGGELAAINVRKQAYGKLNLQ